MKNLIVKYLNAYKKYLASGDFEAVACLAAASWAVLVFIYAVCAAIYK